MTARIIGIGAYAPEQVVTNQDLTKFLDTNDAWIRERTGIGARHVSTSEGTSALATEAAKRAIADAGISPEEIEIVIVATSSPDRAFPSAAADVQGAIGAKHAVAFDITAACSGFIYALHIVQGFIQAGIYKTALIIGAETLSKVLDWTDRSSCILFGDGAGAAVNIERYGNTSAASIPILLDEMHRDGRLKRGDTLVMAGFGAGLTWGAALMTW